MLKKAWIIICIIFVLIMSIIPIFGEEKTVIKVGYPIQSGLTEKTEDGEYVGYTVEYLEEISKYTGWEYEFVEAEGDVNQQLSTLLEMLQNGEIDMMGGMVYSESLAEMFDYPGYSYGTAYTILAVRKDDNRWMPDDYTNWDGIVVGTYEGLKTRLEQLTKFADVNGFTFTTVEYDTQAELRQALYDGEIDATLSVDISMDDEFKEIANFTPVPYYFALSKGNQQLVRELNIALSNIDTANPYLQATLHEKYFSSENDFSLSEEAQEYIQSLGTIQVLMMDGNAPIQYSTSTGAKGISVSYLERFAEDLGLSYTITFANSYEEFLSILETEDIDIVMGVSSITSMNKDVQMTLSLPYLDSYLVQAVYGEQETENALQDVYNTESILQQVNSGDILNADVDLYIANFYLQKKGLYNHTVLQASESSDVQYAIGLVNRDKSRLLSIINVYLNSLTEKQKQEIVYQNTLVEIDYTFTEMIRLYLWQVFTIVLAIFMVGALWYLKRVRRRNALLDLEVMQQKRLNELSRLSNECLFEYDYKEDIMHIENNKTMFEQQHVIENYTNYHQHTFLRDMILKEKDDNYDFELDVNGEMRWYRVQLRVLKNEEGKATYALGRIVDVHDQILKQKELMERSQKDTLTGLLNRSTAVELIRKYIKTNGEGILLILDIDNFKLVNDRRGHPVGDALLQEFSKGLCKFFRKDDIISRLGGDEFMIFIPASITFDSLKNKLCILIERLNTVVFQTYKDDCVSVSIGTSKVCSKDDTFEELYERADHAMYVTKLGGKNGFFMSDERDCLDKDCVSCKEACEKKWYYKEYMKNKEVKSYE